MADLVLDCSDNFETRQAVNLACMKSKTPFISGAAIGWDGQLSTFLYQDPQPCYHCLYPIKEYSSTCVAPMPVLWESLVLIKCLLP
jgi:sulfur carrier protein ThiS adenylyltransferase